MNDPPRYCQVTITVNRDCAQLPGPAEFGDAAERAASRRGADITSAHTAETIISVVTVHTMDRQAALAVGLAVVSGALRHPAGSSTR